MTGVLKMDNSRICEWKYNNYKDQHDTSCGHDFCHGNGGEIYKYFSYCPFCGGTIKDLTK